MVVFYRLEFYGSPHQASLSAPFFQQHLFCSLCVSMSHLVILAIFQSFSSIFLFVMVISDL